MTAALMQRARAAVTPAIAAAFAVDGAVGLRQLLRPEEVTLLRRGIDANLAQPSPRAIVASRPEDPGFFIEDCAERRRRVFSLRLLGDDMRHAPRAWQTLPDFPGLAGELRAGAVMEHPLVPLLVEDAS